MVERRAEAVQEGDGAEPWASGCGAAGVTRHACGSAQQPLDLRRRGRCEKQQKPCQRPAKSCLPEGLEDFSPKRGFHPRATPMRRSSLERIAPPHERRWRCRTLIVCRQDADAAATSGSSRYTQDGVDPEGPHASGQTARASASLSRPRPAHRLGRVRAGPLSTGRSAESPLCRSGEVLKDTLKPNQCTAFGKECTPRTPLGATMVSSEGACAAHYHFGR